MPFAAVLEAAPAGDTPAELVGRIHDLSAQQQRMTAQVKTPARTEVDLRVVGNPNGVRGSGGSLAEVVQRGVDGDAIEPRQVVASRHAQLSIALPEGMSSETT